MDDDDDPAGRAQAARRHAAALEVQAFETIADLVARRGESAFGKDPEVDAAYEAWNAARDALDRADRNVHAALADRRTDIGSPSPSR